jgi:hypothetical protein
MPKLPSHVRFLGWHALQGAVVGLIAGAGLVLTNTAGLGDLFAGTSQPLAAYSLFFANFALTFASVKMGVAIMTIGRDE